MRKIKYPLIVSDFDGTLVNDDGTIAENNKAAISAYIQAGGKFAISTGRMPAGILARARELGLKGVVCCCQGANIMEIESGEMLMEGRISPEITYEICKKMEELGLHIHVYDAWDFYCNMDDEALKLYEKAVRTKGKLVLDKPISEFVKEQKLGAYKVLAMVEPKDNARIFAALTEAGFAGCETTKSAAFLVEVVNKNYSKGTAVEYLATRYGVDLERVIAIGDQINDQPMIERVGLGIAVKNADDALKEIADLVCEYTNEEGAVGKIIEKYAYEENE